MGSPFVDTIMSLEHESKGIKAYSRRDTQREAKQNFIDWSRPDT